MLKNVYSDYLSIEQGENEKRIESFIFFSPFRNIDENVSMEDWRERAGDRENCCNKRLFIEKPNSIYQNCVGSTLSLVYYQSRSCDANSDPISKRVAIWSPE